MGRFIFKVYKSTAAAADIIAAFPDDRGPILRVDQTHERRVHVHVEAAREEERRKVPHHRADLLEYRLRIAKLINNFLFARSPADRRSALETPEPYAECAGEPSRTDVASFIDEAIRLVFKRGREKLDELGLPLEEHERYLDGLRI